MAENQKSGRKNKTLSIKALASALVSIVFCAFLISATIVNRVHIEKLRLEQQIYERVHRLSEEITRLLYKADVLAAIVMQDTAMDSFDIIAPSIVDEPIIKNVIFAPDGIVAIVYPHADDSDKAPGWNYFAEGAGNREAVAARDLGQLVLGGPSDTVQGRDTIFGSLPVFIETEKESNKFWGIVSVELKLPLLLDHAELEIFDTYGYAYELWRINPDTNEKQVIAHNYNRIMPNSRYAEKAVQIFNAQWYLKVSTNDAWYRHKDNIALVIAGFLISLLVFLVMQNNYALKNMYVAFETMAITDSLTGIYNRRHFLSIVHTHIERARHNNENCYLIMFDIDKFKDINDTYGHQIGDKVLMDVTTRVKTGIRPYDLFARYGGEEFLIFSSKVEKKGICEIAERLRLRVCDSKFEYDNVSINVSASFGIAHMRDYNLDKAIKQSDDAMYMAKRNGRNCVVYYSESET